METLEIGQTVRVVAEGMVEKIEINDKRQVTYHVRFPKDGEEGFFKFGHGYAVVDGSIVVAKPLEEGA